MDIKSVQLNDLITRIGLQHQAHALSRGVTLTWELQRDLPVVAGDIIALGRILLNLVDNALKFTPEQGQIDLRTLWQNDMVVVTVSDTGLGVGLEEEQRVFDKYQRGLGTHQQAGIGLGLSIVKTLVEAQYGPIEVVSPGRGACFSVYLPVSEKAKDPH